MRLNLNRKMGDLTMDIESFDRREWAFYWITLVAAKYEQKLEVHLKKEGLDIPSWRVLMLMHPDKPRSVSFLANQSITKQSTMTRIVYRMRDRGLVTVKSSLKDGRVSVVSATSEGLKLRKNAWDVVSKSTNETFEGMSDNKLDGLNKTLSKIFDRLEG